MEILYVNKGTETYVDINLGQRLALFNTGKLYMVKMLKENDISNLVNVSISESDEEISLRYNITRLQTLKSLFEYERPNKMILERLLSGLNDCVVDVEEHLICADDIVLNQENIFYDTKENKVLFLCVPGYGKPIMGQLKMLVELIMRKFDYLDKEGISLLYKMYDKCTSRDYGVRQILIEAENRDEEDLFLQELSDPYISKTAEKEYADENKNNIFSPRLLKECALIIAIVFLAAIKYLYYGKTERDIFWFICVCVIAIGIATSRIVFSEELEIK